MIGDDDIKRKRLASAIKRISGHRQAAQTVRQDRLRKAFNGARKRIRVRILDEFRQHEWPRFQMLDEIFKNHLGLPVPTLSVCGAGTAELRYTKLLTYFFDSRNRHGLGGLLAQAVFAGRIENGQHLPFNLCTARAEEPLGVSQLSDGRDIQNSLDILIEVGDHRILIEQKIRSAEGREQLSRYSAGRRNAYGEACVHCFYLTPEGRKGHEDEWIPLSHRELFCSVAAVLDRHALSPAARHNLRAFVWDLMLGPLAQDLAWVDELQEQTHRVARDYREYINFKKWFENYGMGRDEIRMLAKIVGE